MNSSARALFAFGAALTALSCSATNEGDPGGTSGEKQDAGLNDGGGPGGSGPGGSGTGGSGTGGSGTGGT